MCAWDDCVAKVTISNELCYLAGMLSGLPKITSKICIRTQMPDIEQRFIEIAIKAIGIDPKRIKVEEDSAGFNSVYFYDSKTAHAITSILGRNKYIFRMPTPASLSYLAGIFDSRGHISGNGIYIKGLTPSDSIILEGFGVHTSADGMVKNITRLLKLVTGYSILAEKVLSDLKQNARASTTEDL